MIVPVEKRWNGMTEKIDCEACGTRFGPATAVLVKDYYTCGCGWAVSVKMIKTQEG